MQITTDKVVSCHYRLSETDGVPFEDSHAGNPVLYLHGHHGMLPGLEKALEGKSAGDNFSATLAPKEAYGERREQAPQRVSMKHLINKPAGQLKPGMAVHLNTTEGAREAVIIKVGLKNIDVDANHPLAGKTLTFEVKVIDVRDATEEEIAHGHAHGVGGHQH